VVVVIARWAPVELVVVALVVVAGLRAMHLANADALLPALMSTEELTWFYWGQDRLANLVPLVSFPVRDIRWNIATQLGLIGFGWFTLIALVGANHDAAGERPPRPAVVASATGISGAITIALLTTAKLQVFVFEQLYAFALVLYLVGLMGVTRDAWRWRVPGALLVVAATMVNPSLLLYAPVIIALPGVRPLSRTTAAAVGTSLLAFLLTIAAAARFGDDAGTGQGYNNFSLSRSLDHLDIVLSQLWQTVHGWFALAVVVMAVAVLVMRRATIAPRLRWTYGAVPAFALGWLLMFSGNQWVASNGHNPRYFFPMFAAGVVLITAATTELVGAACKRAPVGADGGPTGWQLTLRAGLAIAAPVGAAVALRTVEIDDLAESRPAVDAALAFDADIIAGDYWTVWPAVIEARAERLDVLGLAYRANPRADEITDRIAHELAGDGLVTVVCVGVDEATCADSLRNWGMRQSRVASKIPLVVEFEPTT
jgi:hypothetical protein